MYGQKKGKEGKRKRGERGLTQHQDLHIARPRFPLLNLPDSQSLHALTALIATASLYLPAPQFLQTAERRTVHKESIVTSSIDGSRIKVSTPRRRRRAPTHCVGHVLSAPFIPFGQLIHSSTQFPLLPGLHVAQLP